MISVDASDILEVAISTRDIKDMRTDEINKLVESHALIQLARDDFLHGYLTWEEYLDLVEYHNVNMDSYLDIVAENLTTVGTM
jgi:hypothetical protein